MVEQDTIKKDQELKCNKFIDFKYIMQLLSLKILCF